MYLTGDGTAAHDLMTIEDSPSPPDARDDDITEEDSGKKPGSQTQLFLSSEALEFGGQNEQDADPGNALKEFGPQA